VNLKNLTLGGILVAALAGGGTAYKQHQDKQNFGNFLNTFRNYAYASYDSEGSESYVKKLETHRADVELKKLGRKLGIKRAGDYFMRNGWIFVDSETNGVKSYYIGKKLAEDEVKELGFKTKYEDVPVYFTRTEGEGIEGVKSFKQKKYGIEEITSLHYGELGSAIFMDISGVEKEAEIVQENYNLFKQNNEYFKNKDSKWSSKRQAIWDALKNFPKEEWKQAYLSEKLNSFLSHELGHGLDKYGERGAYLTQLIKKEDLEMPRPSRLGLRDIEIIASLEGANPIELKYKKIGEELLEDLISHAGSKRKLHEKTDEELSNIARNLLSR